MTDVSPTDEVLFPSCMTGIVSIGLTAFALLTDMDITADGARVVTASNDGSVRIWDADTGVELARNTRHNGAVRIVRFSSSGDTVFSSGEDNTMRSWHWQSRDRVLLGNGECTGEIAPLPHANAFACGSEGGASVYNLDQSVSTVPRWRGYAAHWGWIKLDPPYDGAPSAYGVAVRPSGDEIAIAGPEEDGVSLFPIGEGAHPTQTIRMIEHSPATIPAPSLKLDVAGGATAAVGSADAGAACAGATEFDRRTLTVRGDGPR